MKSTGFLLKKLIRRDVTTCRGLMSTSELDRISSLTKGLHLTGWSPCYFVILIKT